MVNPKRHYGQGYLYRFVEVFNENDKADPILDLVYRMPYRLPYGEVDDEYFQYCCYFASFVDDEPAAASRNPSEESGPL